MAYFVPPQSKKRRNEEGRGTTLGFWHAKRSRSGGSFGKEPERSEVGVAFLEGEGGNRQYQSGFLDLLPSHSTLPRMTTSMTR